MKIHLKNGFDGENVEGENCRPMFDTDIAMEATEYLKELLDFSPRGILNMSWFDRAVTYAKGESAMAYCATLLAPLFELDSKSEAFNKTEYLPLPNGRLSFSGHSRHLLHHDTLLIDCNALPYPPMQLPL